MALKWIALGALVAGCMGTVQAEKGDFFPLEVGNRWVFQKYDPNIRSPEIVRLEETVSTEVIGQVELKERSYFVVRQDWNWFLPDTLYLRKEGAQVFRYIEQSDTVAAGILAQDVDSPDPVPLDPNQTDWLVYDFGAPQGTFWDLPLPDVADPPYVMIWWVIVNARWPGDADPSEWVNDLWVDDIVQVASSRFFRFLGTAWSESEWDEVFEMGVGPIYFWRLTTETEIWDFGLLREAHIGGQTITRDLTTSVEQTSWGQIKASPGDRSMPASRDYRGR